MRTEPITASTPTADGASIRGSAVKGSVPRIRRGGFAVLSPDQADDVAVLARKLAEHLGGPQDVEWAIVAGESYVLQSRPVTTLPTPPAETLQGLGWEKDTVHYPELVTPFGWSLFGPSAEEGGGRIGTDFGLMMNGLEQVSIGGEVYVRPLPPIGSPEPSDSVPPAWAIGLAVRLVPELRRRMKTARRLLAEGLPDRLIERWEREWRPEFIDRTGMMLAEDLVALDDDGLVDHLRRARRLLGDGHVVHFQLLVPYSLALFELVTACRELLGWDEHQAMALLAGSSPASVAGLDALAELRRQVKDRGELAEALRRSPADPVRALETVDRKAAEDLRSWLTTHGWRPTNYDPGSVALAERPGIVTCILLQPDDRTILFGSAGALVTDGGGPLAHAAIVAREHRLPAVVGTVHATRRLRNGQTVTVDGAAGTVAIHEATD